MDKQLICKIGVVEEISETYEIPHKEERKIPLLKKNIKISFPDGQKGLFEARRKEIEHLERNKISVGDKVEVHFGLKLSETKGKTFNNLRIFRIFKADE